MYFCYLCAAIPDEITIQCEVERIEAHLWLVRVSGLMSYTMDGMLRRGFEILGCYVESPGVEEKEWVYVPKPYELPTSEFRVMAKRVIDILTGQNRKGEIS